MKNKGYPNAMLPHIFAGFLLLPASVGAQDTSTAAVTQFAQFVDAFPKQDFPYKCCSSSQKNAVPGELTDIFLDQEREVYAQARLVNRQMVWLIYQQSDGASDQWYLAVFSQEGVLASKTLVGFEAADLSFSTQVRTTFHGAENVERCRQESVLDRRDPENMDEQVLVQKVCDRISIGSDGTSKSTVLLLPEYLRAEHGGGNSMIPGSEHLFGSCAFMHLDHCDKRELRLLRNEIFARHGYTFRDEYLKNHFQAQSWYKPTTTEVPTNELTSDEREILKSISLLEAVNFPKPGERR